MVVEVVVEAKRIAEVVVEEGLPHLDLGKNIKNVKEAGRCGAASYALSAVLSFLICHWVLGNPMENNNLKAEQIAT